MTKIDKLTIELAGVKQMNKTWKKLTVTTNKANSETVIGVISYILNIDGVEEFELENNQTCINIYLPITPELSRLDVKKHILQNLPNIEFDLKIKDFDYDPAIETEWKKYFKPQKIGRNIVIRPSWETYDAKDGDVVITIDPGIAFGTGLHGTTRGVIILLEEILEERTKHTVDTNKFKMLDAGTGSGILAIAAYKLGIKNIKAIDNDIEAVNNTKENLIANGIQHGITVEHQTLEDLTPEKERYDIVLANIVPDVLIPNKDLLTKILNNSGDLILSGILIKEEKRVLDEFLQTGTLRFIKSIRMDEWTSLWFKL